MFIHSQFEIVENVLLARDTYRLRLHAPDVARSIRPGQFVMLRLPGTSDPLLGRPFALYDVAFDNRQQPAFLDIVYLVVGKLTGALAALRPGDSLIVWGPLGNGFPAIACPHLALVAGGIGQTPFLACIKAVLGKQSYGGLQSKQTVDKVTLCYGVRRAEFLAGVDDFRAAGAEVFVATDDGSAGFHGFVTDLVEQLPRPDRLIGCGPEPMMHRLALLAKEWAIPCHLSLESPMACGAGICFSCVTKVRTESGWDFRRVCVDGPVFDAAALVFED
ncbi:MAG: dihydroorotate dehydrogenase [Gemmatales bacterium]|nr:MAG: dihydroorotate dehydrogenase [Gemmatales bacterium]